MYPDVLGALEPANLQPHRQLLLPVHVAVVVLRPRRYLRTALALRPANRVVECHSARETMCAASALKAIQRLQSDWLPVPPYHKPHIHHGDWEQVLYRHRHTELEDVHEAPLLRVVVKHERENLVGVLFPAGSMAPTLNAENKRKPPICMINARA
jgi:hypothetical protein